MNLGNLSRLKIALKARNDEDYQKGDIHQAILNIGYEWWQSVDEKDGYGYCDMIEYMNLSYGPLAAFAVLCGKYNQQVENGGHYQYFDNRYAGGDKRYPPKDGVKLHEKMIAYAERFGFGDDEIAKPVIEIWKEFEIVEDDEDDYDDPPYTVYNHEELDSAYYKINENWMGHFNEILKETLLDTDEKVASQ